LRLEWSRPKPLAARPVRQATDAADDALVVEHVIARPSFSISCASLASAGGGLIDAAAGLQHLLFGVAANDPIVMAMAGALVLGVSTLACLVPAFRATRVDPVRLLRA